MALIAPFKGTTYNLPFVKDISRLVTPPYDVISEDDRKRYYASHPNNIIRLVLGEKKTGDSDWDNRYTRAADYLNRWEAHGILIRSTRHCVYLTSHTFSPGTGGQPLTRWGLVVLVHIEEEGSGIILPHEKTFSAHKDDRLKLMRACNANFSQIFALYDDPSQNALSLCRKHCDYQPLIQFEFEDGSLHRMWEISNSEIFSFLAHFFRNRSIYIADGHHRYETSRNYRNIMRARYGRRPPNKSYEFTLMYLCGMQDIGLKVLSSHRLLRITRHFEITSFLEKQKENFDIEQLSLEGKNNEHDAVTVSMSLRERGMDGTALAVCTTGSHNCHILRLKPGMEVKLGTDLHPAQKKLDVIVLSRLILQKGLGLTKEDLDDDQLIHYESNMAKALSGVREGRYRLAFLLNPTRIEQVKEVADSRLVMPRKSTYFYPKVLSGMVFNKIDPHETLPTL